MARKPVKRKLEELYGLDELKLGGVLRISQRQTESVQQLLDNALDEVVTLFESRLGYIYYYSEETREFTLHAWSRDVMAACSIPSPPTLYQLDKTGIWGEAVRQRRPIIINDFQAPHPLKKGYPEGHAPLTRFMTIPVIINEKIVAVVGLANKASDYTETDVRQLVLMMDPVWNIVQRKQAEDDLHTTNTKLQTLFTLSQMSEEPVDKIGDFALEGAIQLTGSEFGAVFLLDEDKGVVNLLSWSKQVMEQCAMDDKAISFGKDDLGFMARAIHRHEPTIINDCSAAEMGQHGYPEGHLPVTRFVNVPLVNEGQMVLCIAVANKTTVYTSQDLQLISLIMNDLWRVIQKKRSEATIRRMNEELEQRVMERTEELDRFFSMTLDLLCIADTDGYFRRLNRSWESTLGYSLAELEGCRFLDLVHPDDLAATLAAVSQLAADKPVSNFTNRYVCKDGSYRWIEWRAIPYGGRLIYAAARDITERKHIDDELRESRQQLANIIDFLPDATFVVDNDMKVIAWNRAMEEMTGVSKEQMLGQGDYAYTVPFYGERRRQLLDLLNVDDAELEAKYQHVKRKGETLYAEVVAPALYGGRGAYLWVSGTPLYSTENKRVGAIEIIRDITERKKVEEELQQATLAAESANSAKSEFLANMSHEIRTPMNAITGMAYLALQTGLDRQQREYVGGIQKAADSLLCIINDILDFSKIEAGKMELESVYFDLNELFSFAGNISAARLAEKDLEIFYAVPSDIPNSLVGDPLRLGQILNNLISNAIKFTEKGKITIGVASGPVVAQPGRIALTFSVADTGIGMEQEQLQRIFKPFTQADSSITRRFGGTGLGLAIVIRLLELMGSKLEVVSRPGHGSTFAFTVELGLPADQLRTDLKIPEDLRNMRVLVVDDSVDASKVLELMLSELSFRAVSAASGAAALRELVRAATTAGESPYRLVLLDWRMPGMDGLETVRRIRSEPMLSPAPEIIIMSGYTTSPIHDEARKLGIRAFLAKPFQLAAVYDLILETFGKMCPLIPYASQTPAAGGGSKQLKGVRVLLVEDNKVNQIVALEMLKQFGALVVTADNGREAVEAVVGDGEFDMVFMDIQMPEMDGYEAAIAIRRIKGDFELPIIAMTAHAFNEEREHCLAVGMNDHIAKPIDPDQLYSVLLRWIRPGKITGVSGQPQNNHDGDSPAVFPDSLQGIDVASVLERCNGNRVLAQEIIISFRDQNLTAGEEIRTALARGDRGRARFLIHNIKGVSSTIGAPALSGTMTELETSLAAGNEAVSPDLLAAMERQLEEVFQAATVLEKMRGDSGGYCVSLALMADELPALLKKLHDTMMDNDLDALRLFEGLKDYLRPPEREELSKYIARFDFEKGVATLERVARSFGIELQVEGRDDLYRRQEGPL